MNDYKWEYSRGTWTYADALHVKGWITGWISEDGERMRFGVTENSGDGSVFLGEPPTLEAAKKLLIHTINFRRL